MIQGPRLLRTTLYYLMTMALPVRNQSRLITVPPGRHHRAQFGGHLPHRPHLEGPQGAAIGLYSLSASVVSANGTSRRCCHALPLFPLSSRSERKERSGWEKMRSFGGLLAKKPAAIKGHVCLTCLPCVRGQPCGLLDTAWAV